jgi:hypothetical protein
LFAGVVAFLALVTVAAAAGPVPGQNKPIGTEPGSNGWAEAQVFFLDRDPSDCLAYGGLLGASDSPTGDSAYAAFGLDDSCTGTSVHFGFEQPIAIDSSVIEPSLKSAHVVFTVAADDGTPVTFDVTWTSNGDPVQGRPKIDTGLKVKWALIRGANVSATITVNGSTYTITDGGIIWRGVLMN